MLGKLSIIGAVGAIIMIPTAPSAQMGALLTPALPFVVLELGSLARIWGLGARRVITVATIGILRSHKAAPMMARLKGTEPSALAHRR